MNRKNKILAVLAIGAVALVVASGIARCSLSGDVAPPNGQASEQAEQVAEQDGSVATPDHEETAAAQGGFADLKNTSWESEDGKSALSIIEGAFIETGESGSTILYYTLDEESREGGELTATLSVSRTMTGDEEKTVAVVREDQSGKTRITCDKLASAYTLNEPEATGPITLSEATRELFDEFGKGEDEFVSVISEYTKSASPKATSATWSKEVWIDYASGTRLTNFTLNDAASTIVCVQAVGDGRLGVL